MFESNLQAINAARKQYGASYKDFVRIEKLAVREWSIQLRQMPQATGECLLTDRAGAFEFPTAAISPWRSVSGKLSPWEAERLEGLREAFKDEALQAIDLTAEQARADKIANNALFEGTHAEAAEYLRDHHKCPKCGSTEVFTGYIKKDIGGMGLVEDDDRVGGCQLCDFSFDFRKAGKTWVRQSTIPKPTKQVWYIADEMIAANPKATRSEIQAECVRRGIASGTARTQYQAWKKAGDNDRLNAEKAREASKRFNGN